MCFRKLIPQGGRISGKEMHAPSIEGCGLQPICSHCAYLPVLSPRCYHNVSQGPGWRFRYALEKHDSPSKEARVKPKTLAKHNGFCFIFSPMLCKNRTPQAPSLSKAVCRSRTDPRANCEDGGGIWPGSKGCREIQVCSWVWQTRHN